MHTLISMSIGFILFLYNLFLCDIDSIYTMFFFLILLVILYGPRVCNKRLNRIQMVACSRQIRFSLCFDLLLLHARFIISLGKIITFVKFILIINVIIIPSLKNNALNRHLALLSFMQFSYYLTHCKLSSNCKI